MDDILTPNNSQINHFPVMLDQIEKLIKYKKYETIIDCTFGAGGHSKMFLNYCNKLTAFDRDDTVENFVFKHDKFQFIHDQFSNINKHIVWADFIFADLGMSSMQINSHRGFSFMIDSDLDMRMGTPNALNTNPNGTLKNILNYMPTYKIKEIIEKYGEEKQATLIAHNIDRYRLRNKIITTLDLRKAIGIDKFSLLARVFQSFRIFINNEIEELELLLKNIMNMTDNVMILTFHSLEDRLVKNAFKNFKYKGFLLPGNDEITINTNSRSAKLRFASNNYSFKETLINKTK